MTLNQFIYRMSRPLGGLKLAKFLSRNHPKILMYHRITEDPNGEGLTADQFRQQVRIIKRDFVPMTLRDLLKAHEDGKVPENAVVVTFDDGYADFAEVAFPILEAEGVPATLFVTTGFVNGDIWLWPDQVEYAIKNANSDKVKIPGLEKTLNITEHPMESWNCIADHCVLIADDEKLRLINDLFSLLKVPWPTVIPKRYRALTWNQVNDMCARGLDLGSHSVSHPILTKIGDELLFEELIYAKNMIEDKIGLRVDTFCYPNGREIDFDDRVRGFVKRCGYRYAVAAFPSRTPMADSYCINRYPVGISFEIFIKNIYGYSYLVMRDNND